MSVTGPSWRTGDSDEGACTRVAGVVCSLSPTGVCGIAVRSFLCGADKRSQKTLVKFARFLPRDYGSRLLIRCYGACPMGRPCGQGPRTMGLVCADILAHVHGEYRRDERHGCIPNWGVGTVWWGISGSGGWSCKPSLGKTQCRRQARHLQGSDRTGGTWFWLDTFDWAPVTNVDTRSD